MIYKIHDLDTNEDDDEDRDKMGSILIPGLRKMFDSPSECYRSEGEHEVDALGDRDDYELRKVLFSFDNYDERFDESRYYGVHYVATDNVLLISSDYEAAISDAHPITVPSYLELCLATACLVNRTYMLERGYGGDHQIIDFPPSAYEGLYPWSKSIENAKNKKVSPEFFALTELATENDGYRLQYMDQA